MDNLGRLFAAVVITGFFIAGAVYAGPEETAGSAQREEAIVDVGNKICPLTGEDVDGKTYQIYKGRRYGLCCQECGANFWQDPETYSMLAEKEVSGK
jgi:YHS domain.